MSKKQSFLDKVKAAFYSKDEEALNKALDELPQTGEQLSNDADEDTTHIHVHGSEGGITRDEFESHKAEMASKHQEFSDAIAALQAGAAPAEKTADEAEELNPEEGDNVTEGQLKEESPVGTSDKAIKATDSSYLAASFKESAALAEILAPGIRIPAFDRAADPKQSFKKLCGFRRSALDLAYAQPATRSMIDDVLSGKTLDTKGMTCDAVRTVFKAVAAMKKTANNDASRGNGSAPYTPVVSKDIKSVKDISAAWEAQHNKKLNG